MNLGELSILGAGYLICAGLGWYLGVGPVPVKEGEGGLSGRRHVGNRSGLAAVDDWIKASQADAAIAEEALPGKGPLEQMRDSLEPSPNPREDFLELSEKLKSQHLRQVRTAEEQTQFLADLQTMLVRLEEWMVMDPSGAAAAEESALSIVRQGIAVHHSEFGRYFIDQVGDGEALEIALLSRSPLTSAVARMLASEIAKRGDLESAAGLLQAPGSEIVMLLTADWDLARRDELLSVFGGQHDDLDFAVSIFSKRLEKDELLPWLRDLVSREGLKEETVQRIAERSLYQTKGKGMGLEERFAFTNELRLAAGLPELSGRASTRKRFARSFIDIWPRKIPGGRWSSMPEGAMSLSIHRRFGRCGGGFQGFIRSGFTKL